jgi:hypothetical protein
MKSLVVIFFSSWFAASTLFAQSESTETIVYYENFDSLSSGWVGENLGSPTSPSIWRITDSISFSQPNSFVSNDGLTNQYPEGIFDALISTPILLPAETELLKVEFRFIADLAFNGFVDSSDYWYLEISDDDGQTWDLVTNERQVRSGSAWWKYPDYFSSTQDGYITEYAGSTVKFRFVLNDMPDGLIGQGLFIDDFTVISFTCNADPFEPNDTPETAFTVSYGDTIAAEICPLNDYDYFSFTAQAGDFVRVYERDFLTPRAQIYILDSNLDPITNNFYQTDLRFFAPSDGIYFIWILQGINQTFSANYHIGIDTLSPNPDILSVQDVPDDQGLQVRVVWKASYYDPPTGNSYTDFYALWRQVEDTTEMPVLNLNELTNEQLNDQKLLQTYLFEFDNMFWDFVDQIPAVPNRPFMDYSYVAPTLYDNQPTTFIVCAVPKQGYQLPALWGNPGTGISIDNMIPEFLSFGIERLNNMVELTWNVNLIVHHDLMGYRIYRHTNTGFVPDESNQLVILPAETTEYLDESINNGIDYFYKIEAVDDAGNSAWSEELSSSVTSLGSQGSLPDKFALLQNYPNPFNPSTKIKYQLPSGSNVSLKVYDILGKEVAVLVNEFNPAGFYEVTFDAANITSGIYFYKIEAGEINQINKMILLR